MTCVYTSCLCNSIRTKYLKYEWKSFQYFIIFNTLWLLTHAESGIDYVDCLKSECKGFLFRYSVGWADIFWLKFKLGQCNCESMDFTLKYFVYKYTGPHAPLSPTCLNSHRHLLYMSCGSHAFPKTIVHEAELD